jgi:hypothetical protein
MKIKRYTGISRFVAFMVSSSSSDNEAGNVAGDGWRPSPGQLLDYDSTRRLFVTENTPGTPFARM